MQFLLTCTTEELTLLVTMCGYPHVAKGVAEETLGKKSSKEWEAMLEATTHQLMLKQIWDDEKFANDEVPLTDDMQAFIKNYVESKWMLRCSDLPRESALMFHHFEGEKWLRHIIHKDIIHEFSYIGAKEISEQINDYYSFEIDQSHIKEEFRITDEVFDLLSDKNRIKKVRKMSSFLSKKKQASINSYRISKINNGRCTTSHISTYRIMKKIHSWKISFFSFRLQMESGLSNTPTIHPNRFISISQLQRNGTNYWLVLVRWHHTQYRKIYQGTDLI